MHDHIQHLYSVALDHYYVCDPCGTTPFNESLPMVFELCAEFFLMITATNPKIFPVKKKCSHLSLTREMLSGFE